MADVTPSLEFSADPLSDTSPTWIDVTSKLLSANWSDGRSNELDAPQAGAATFVLDNRDRRFEPEYAGVLTNMIRNPSFETNLTEWSSAGSGTTTRTRDNTQSRFGSWSQKCVTDGTFSGQGANFNGTGNVGVVANPGETWTLSGYFFQAAGGMNAQIAIEWLNAGGGSISTSTANLVLGAGTWTRHSVTATAPALTAKAFCRFRTAAGVAVTFFIDGCQMEEASSASTYVDGDQDNARWSGTAHASASYLGGPYYPNIVPLRRFRLRLTSGSTYDMGIWYVTDWGPEWPDGFLNQTATVTCTDGFGLLTLDALDQMDPPSASSYEEVVSYDQPSFGYPLGEPEGTRVVSHVRRIKHLAPGSYPRPGYNGNPSLHIRRWKTTETRAEVEGVSGPSGTYKNAPTLGVPGLIVGDSGTAVLFGASADSRFGGAQTYARIPLDQSDLIDSNKLSIEVWQNGSSVGGTWVSGPLSTAAGDSVFELGASGGAAYIRLRFTNGTSLLLTEPGSISANFTHHVVGTWDGQTAKVYVNGVEMASETQTGVYLRQGNADDFLRIGVNQDLTGPSNLILDEVAIYEKALSPARILAHYDAGANRGYAEQLAGDRIEAIVTSDLWSEANIQTGGFNVQPTFKFGQGKLDEILRTEQAENPSTHFYFNGTGDPVYLGWDYKAASPYNTVQATFGNGGGGEVQYVDLSVSYDDEMFNRVTIAADGGEGQTAEDATSQAAYNMTGGSRAFSLTGLPMSEDTDAARVAGLILDGYANPQFRFTSLSLTANDSSQKTQILNRQIGEPIRIKHRPKDGTAIDIVTHILGRSFSLELGSTLNATWTLSRGFNAGDGFWRAGMVGFSEAGATTKAK